MTLPTQQATPIQPSYKMLRIKQVIEYTGLSRSTIYELMNQHSHRYDASFPKSIPLTTATVCWLESEIIAWLESKVQQSRKG